MSVSFDIPGYQILEKIGSGSTATVWRARQESLDRDVAIKVLHPELWTQIGEADAFLAEAHSVAQLRSRHIIQVYDTGRIDGTAYIVLEYVAGVTLAEHLQEVTKMPPREAMQIVTAVADALSDAWNSAGMIHRDIKPENIIIEPDGSVKLADLGLAHRIDSDIDEDATAAVVGTPNYMSPEQANGSAQLSPATDMYSLGATLYHMLTGKIPFGELSVEEVLDAQISEQLPWPQDLDSHIPLSYCQFVARLMMKHPEDRFSDWNVVYSDAVKLAEGRMLMVKLPHNCKSTIAGAGKMPTAHKKIIKLKKPHASLHPTEHTPRKPSVPDWLMRTLHLGRAAAILAMLWLFLLRPLLNTIDKPHRTLPGEEEQRTVAAPPDATVPRAEPDDDEPYDYNDDDFFTDSSPQPHRDDPGIPRLTQSQQTKKELLTLLVQQEYEDALAFWRASANQIDSSLRRDVISEFMLPENMPQAMLGDALNRYIGREITIQIGGQSIVAQIERIDSDLVEAMRHTQSGSARIMRPFTFRISLLSYSDQMRLLRETTNPYAPYAEVLVALHGADFQTAVENASRMGPLEDTVRAFAQNRIDKLVQP